MSSAAPFRAFIGLPPEGGGQALGRLVAARLRSPDAPPGRWQPVPAERIHLTLRFLGDVAPHRREAVESLVRDTARRAVPADSVPTGWSLLPSARRPAVLALTVSDPAGRLRTMAEALHRGVEDLGFPREERPFLPHVTLARLRPSRVSRTPMAPDAVTGRASMGTDRCGAGGGDTVAGPGEAPTPPADTLRWRTLIFYRSEPGRGGPVYRPLLSVPLGG